MTATDERALDPGHKAVCFQCQREYTLVHAKDVKGYRCQVCRSLSPNPPKATEPEPPQSYGGPLMTRPMPAESEVMTKPVEISQVQRVADAVMKAVQGLSWAATVTIEVTELDDGRFVVRATARRAAQ